MDLCAPPCSADDVTARVADDESLLAALQRRDAAAFETLVRAQAQLAPVRNAAVTFAAIAASKIA